MASAGFEQIRQTASEEIKNLIDQTINLIMEEYPQVTEVAWIKQKVIGYGIGPKKMSEHFCWIGVYSRHIILGFNYGTMLPDPDHILEGTGNLFRHYKIRSAADLLNPALRTIIKEALTDIKHKNHPAGK